MPRVHRQGAESAEAAEFFLGVHREALCNKNPQSSLLGDLRALGDLGVSRSDARSGSAFGVDFEREISTAKAPRARRTPRARQRAACRGTLRKARALGLG